MSAVDDFPAPTPDSESSSLLQSISAHGGYAYVRMSTLAASGDFRAAEAAREMAWEQLHSGPWHSVLPVWRDAYSMACLHVAKHHFVNREYSDALRVLDMGIIMGGPLLRNDLDRAVKTVSEKASELRRTTKSRTEAEAETRRKKLVEEMEEGEKAELVRILPAKSLSCKSVQRRSGVSMESFLRDYMGRECPVIISDSMEHWPARSKWNDLEYLKTVAGDRTVPVEEKACSRYSLG